MNLSDLIAIDLRVVGFLLLGLAIAHGFFEHHFKWREELSRVSLLARQIFYVHHFFIALVLAMIGLLTLLIPKALLKGDILAVSIDLGLTVFWAIRWYCQLFVYRQELWKGKSFETTVHLSFSSFWAYCSLSFGLAALIAWQHLR